MLYDLYAERDCCATRGPMMRGELTALADHVEEADADWPEGFDAVARPVGRMDHVALYAGDWEYYTVDWAPLSGPPAP